MNKYSFTFLLFTLSLLARYDAYPSKACPAFNNMRHTQNTHSVELDTGREYTVLQNHKGQKLILVKGEQPAQRWVDGECFAGSQNSAGAVNIEKAHSKAAETERVSSHGISKQNLLALSWHNAFCETHRSKRECRTGKGSRYSDTRFTLHGLWPQPRENVYCDVPYDIKKLDKNRLWYRLPILGLSDGTLNALMHLMPGSASNLHRHEWVKHGTCYGTNAEQYFKDAISLVEQVNRSKVGIFFAQNVGKVVTLKQIRFKVDESFGKGSGKKVEMRCYKGMVTELWFHLGGGSNNLSQLLKEGRNVRSRCRQGRIDRVGF